MNSGLSTLTDAIFGKQDLDSVSLEELYEVVNEFPSFNAVHYMLSIKLGHTQDESFDKESKRTALYFNNPLWLQSLLEDSVNRNPGVFSKSKPEIEIDPPAETISEAADIPQETGSTGFRESRYEEVIEEVITDPSGKYGQTDMLTEYKPEEPLVQPAESFPVESNDHLIEHTGTVSSFDELMSKYNIHITEPEPEILQETPKPVPEEITGTIHEVIEKDSLPRFVENLQEHQETAIVLNEYGIFEEADIKPVDLDLIAFDRPMEEKPDNIQSFVPDFRHGEIIPFQKEAVTENAANSENTFIRLPEKSDDADYASFDRPLETPEKEEPGEQPSAVSEMNSESMEDEANDTGEFLVPGEPENEMNGPVQELVSQFSEKHKSMPLFDTKKAESIVFAPYHMIDYFASQGIKLVLEDHPADNFGKQLKSFTDWLKVMKKLPAQPGSEKSNEKDSDRIRHFAEHSVEERDILTESMAEVLAKQGMYENAIALYQKLSLIYPPKSAYFASRIEQIKASLS